MARTASIVRMDRRRYMYGMAAGATLCTWPQALRGMAAEAPAVKFLVATDTHLGRQDSPAAERQWTKTVAALAKADGDFVLHLGDVVDGGREAQYPIYAQSRAALGKPIYEIPGNHDPAELFEKYVRAPIDFALDHRWLRILLVGNARPESHDGFLEPRQLDWLEAQCVDAAKQDRRVLIAMHVPVHDNRHPDRGWHVKKEHGQAEFYALAARHARRLVAVFHGHFHNGLRGWSDRGGLHEICFPSALYNQDRQLEAQQAPGYNPLEFRPGFCQVRVDAQGLQVAYRPLEAPDPPVEKRLPSP